jgi:hypothetical protein
MRTEKEIRDKIKELSLHLRLARDRGERRTCDFLDGGIQALRWVLGEG